MGSPSPSSSWHRVPVPAHTMQAGQVAGTCPGETSKVPSAAENTQKVLRTALRALKLRLDRVGRRMATLHSENQALSNRLAHIRGENAKLHQALSKERSKLKNLTGPSTTPTPWLPPTGSLISGLTRRSVINTASTDQDPWTLPSVTPVRSSLPTDIMTPSTSSASLDAILTPRRLVLPTSVRHPPLVSPLPLSFFSSVGGPRSVTSLQDGSDDPLFLCADLFEDGTSDDSMTTNAAASLRASMDAVPSTSTAPKVFSSSTTVTSNREATSKDQQQQSSSAASLRVSERKRLRRARASLEPQPDADDKLEVKFSTSSSSLD